MTYEHEWPLTTRDAMYLITFVYYRASNSVRPLDHVVSIVVPVSIVCSADAVIQSNTYSILIYNSNSWYFPQRKCAQSAMLQYILHQIKYNTNKHTKHRVCFCHTIPAERLIFQQTEEKKNQCEM